MFPDSTKKLIVPKRKKNHCPRGPSIAACMLPAPVLWPWEVWELVNKHLIDDDDDGDNKEAQSHNPQVDNPQFEKKY